MSHIVVQDVLFGGAIIQQYTNINTGTSAISYQGQTLAYTKDVVNWFIPNISLIKHIGNEVQSPEILTNQDVEAWFQSTGKLQLNEARGNILNSNSLYPNPQYAYLKQKGFYEMGIPLIIDPSTGKVNNRYGKSSTAPLFGTAKPALEGKVEYTDDIPDEVRSPQVDSGVSTGATPGFPNGVAFNELPSKDPGEGALVGGVKRSTLKSLGTNAEFLTSKQESSTLLVFPSTGTEDSMDYIKIQSYQYEPSFGRSENDYEFNLGTPVGPSIFLPMQPTIASTNAVQFGEDKLNPLQNELAQLVTGASEGNLETDIIGQIGNAVTADKDKLKSLLTGKLVGASGIIARATGSIVNPNMELLFQGPKLRGFQFNFQLTPRNQTDSSNIRKIVKTFKKNMAPQKSESKFFLNTPNIFKLEYIMASGEPHPWLPKMKPCALTECTTNFTPDGTYMTYGDGSMTSYGLTLTFNELLPIFASDYTDGDQMDY